MNHLSFYLLLALAAGSCLPTQAGINSQLNQLIRSPIMTAAISFLMGTVSLIIYASINGNALPPIHSVKEGPWWIWFGGLLGAFLVASTVVLAPKLGATSMLSLIIAGQMITSVILDHFGILGYPVQPISIQRFFGASLIIAGVFLIRRS